MKLAVMENLKRKLPDGSMQELRAGQVVEVKNVASVYTLIAGGKLRPLDEVDDPAPVLEKIWLTISAPYFRRGYPLTREVLHAEDRIAEVQQAVFRGEMTPDDFRRAVSEWEAVVVEAIERKGIKNE